MPSFTFSGLIPSDWDPADQLAHWLDISPNLTLPVGHAHHQPPNRQNWTIAATLSKGVTHWAYPPAETELGSKENFRAAYPNKEYNNVPRIRDQFGLSFTPPDNWVNGYNLAWWPNGPYNETQARDKADQQTLTHLWIGETMEGDDYMPESQQMWYWYYDQLRNRYETRKLSDSLPFWLCHNYFCRFANGNSVYNLGEQSRAQHKALYASDPSTWPATLYHTGGTLSRTNLIIFDLYINEPTSLPRRLLQTLCQMELAREMGFEVGMFWFDQHEWHPGFASNTYLPLGIFERSDKPELDPSIQMLIVILAHEYGTVSVDWGLPSKPQDDKTVLIELSQFGLGQKDRWYPYALNGGTEPYPNYVYGGSYYVPRPYMADMVHFGLRKWIATGGQTVGGTVYYLEFRIDGGAWIVPDANQADVVDAFFDERGLARARVLGSQMSVLYFNLYADNLVHTLEMKHPTNPATTYTTTVCGLGPFIHLFSI